MKATTEADRKRQAARVTAKMVANIASLTGNYTVPDDAWEAVAEADATYNETLVRWIKSGTPEDLDAFHKAHDALGEAWKAFGG